MKMKSKGSNIFGLYIPHRLPKLIHHFTFARNDVNNRTNVHLLSHRKDLEINIQLKFTQDGCVKRITLISYSNSSCNDLNEDYLFDVLICCGIIYMQDNVIKIYYSYLLSKQNEGTLGLDGTTI